MEAWVFALIGAILILDTALVLFVSNVNTGAVFPAAMGFPFLIYGAFYEELNVWFQTDIGLLIKYCFVIGYLAFFLLMAVSLVLIRGAVWRKPKPGADVVVVLGAGLKDGKPSRLLRNRLNVAMQYAEENYNCKVIVSGGRGKNERVSEAAAMRQYLLEMGFPASRIMLEDRSTTTRENLLYSRALLKRSSIPFRRAILATSDFHVFRATRLARSIGWEMEGLSAPSAWYMAFNFYLRETMAIVRQFVL